MSYFDTDKMFYKDDLHQIKTALCIKICTNVKQLQLYLKKCLIFNFFEISDEMKINFVGKRHPPFHHWEPIYIGTNEDPLYDERLSWEGRADKMTQVN